MNYQKKKNARVSETFCQTHGVHVLKGNEKKNAGVSESTQRIQNRRKNLQNDPLKKLSTLECFLWQLKPRV